MNIQEIERMGFEINMINARKYIRVSVSGEIKSGEEYKGVLILWSGIFQRWRKVAINNLFCVLDIQGLPPVGALHDIVKSLDTFGWKRNYRLAVLDRNNQTINNHFFMENVACNHGYSFKVFESEHVAVDWLNSDM